MPFSAFLSYSHQDRELRKELEKHLSNLRRQNVISSWYDGDISPGTEWESQILTHLNTDQIILLLISADFMASDFCYSIEMTKALQRHNADQARVLPIILRPTDWKGAPFAKLKVLPTDGKPVTRWPTHDDAFEDVVQGIRKAIEELRLLHEESGTGANQLPPSPSLPSSATTNLMQHMETAFADHDWPDVIRKATYLIKRTTGNVSSSVYRMQAVALVEEGQVQAAQEAFETALALVSDRALRLILLSDYTTLLAQQEQWDEVLQQAREALRFVPNDPGWLATQQQAQSKRVKPVAVPPSLPLSHKPSPALGKTKEQWLEEGNSLRGLKRYEEAITAYDQAIRLDPNDAAAYYNKGNSLQRLGKHREAQQAHDRAKQLGYSS